MQQNRYGRWAMGILGLTTGAAIVGCLSLSTDEGSGGANSSSSSTSSTSSGGCKSDKDCPRRSACETVACKNYQCDRTFLPVGTICGVDAGACDEKGACLNCSKNEDCTGKLAQCIDYQCVSCDDGYLNGEETDVDCGGTCGQCLGASCQNGSDCARGFCADGVCCDGACTSSCRACNIPGTVGRCENVPNGQTDPDTCKPTEACNGLVNICLRKNGEFCLTFLECLSGRCMSNVCAP